MCMHASECTFNYFFNKRIFPLSMFYSTFYYQTRFCLIMSLFTPFFCGAADGVYKFKFSPLEARESSNPIVLNYFTMRAYTAGIPLVYLCYCIRKDIYNRTYQKILNFINFRAVMRKITFIKNCAES